MLNNITPAQILGLFLFLAIIALIVVYRKYINVCFEVERLQRVNKNKTETVKRLEEDWSRLKDISHDESTIINTLLNMLSLPPVAVAKGVIKKTYSMKIEEPSVRIRESNKTSNIDGILLYRVSKFKEYISAKDIQKLSKIRSINILAFLEEHTKSEEDWIEISKQIPLKRGIKRPRNRE